MWGVESDGEEVRERVKEEGKSGRMEREKMRKVHKREETSTIGPRGKSMTVVVVT